MIKSILKQLSLWRCLKRLDATGCSARSSWCRPGFSVQATNLWENRIIIGKGGLLEGVIIFEKKDSGTVKIGNRCHLGSGTKLISIDSIEIGDDVTIAWGCTIYDHDSHSIHWNERQGDTTQEIHDLIDHRDFLFNKKWTNVNRKKIIIQSKVWIGFGVTILKGVTIGEGAVIGACSVVSHDIPPYSIAAGNPARLVRYISVNKEHKE